VGKVTNAFRYADLVGLEWARYEELMRTIMEDNKDG
jgi:hypothetical protein